MSRVLVVAPHPDDEVIGCGGAILDHVAAGDSVEVIFLTSGEGGGHGAGDPGGDREREAKAAAKVLGVSGIEFWGEPDGALRATRPLIERLRRRIGDMRPFRVYVTHEGEMHPDHRAAARLVLASLPKPNGAPVVIGFEVWTPLQLFDHSVDITPYLERKLRAIREYEGQQRVMRFDDAFRGLARYRGEMHNWPGGEYAEVFSVMAR